MKTKKTLLGLIFSAAIGLTSAQSPEVQQLLQQAEQFKQAGQTKKMLAAYQKAAAQNDGEAFYRLGLAYSQGNEYDYDKAVRNLQKAVELNHPKSYSDLGALYQQEGEDQKSLPLFQKAVEQGDLRGYENIAGIYESGSRHIRQDYRKAFLIYRQCAKLGHPSCLTRMGNYYDPEYSIHSTAGVQESTEKAKEYYLKAIEKNDLLAMRDLADIYYNQEEDYPKAIEYYAMLAEQPEAKDTSYYPYATVRLGYIYANGQDHGVTQDIAKAIEYYEAALPDTTAAFNLGDIYENGTGVPRNLALARKYYRIAKENGDEDAAARLREISPKRKRR